MLTVPHSQHFPTVYPNLRSYHVWPGFVHSGAVAKAFPSLAPLITIAGPLLAVTVGHTPASYAEIPIYILCNPVARGELKRYRRPSSDSDAWTETESDSGVSSSDLGSDLSTTEDYVDAEEDFEAERNVRVLHMQGDDNEDAKILHILGDDDLEESELQADTEWWRTLQFSNEKLARVRPTRWVTEDEESTQIVWDLLVGMVGE